MRGFLRSAVIQRKDNKKRNEKDRLGRPVFFGEGISFLMGCSKNYIMYWGVTFNNIPYFERKVLTKIWKFKGKNCILLLLDKPNCSGSDTKALLLLPLVIGAEVLL